MTQPILAIFGATGSQGGSVVRHLVDQGGFRVRALTRRPADYAGPAHEAVYADLDVPDSLPAALEGVHGVFLVTNFWQPGTDEVAQASAAVRAAKAAGVQHLVWSTLPDVATLADGRWEVPHFTDKARVDALVRDAGFPVHTFVQAPFYFENLLGLMAPQALPDGRVGWALPMDPNARAVHMGSIAELGRLVTGIFAHPEQARGQTLSMAAGRYSWSDVARAFGEVTGREHAFLQVPHAVFEGFFPGAREIGQMLGYFEDHTYMGPDAEPRIEAARAIATGPFTPLEAFLATHLSSGTPA